MEAKAKDHQEGCTNSGLEQCWSRHSGEQTLGELQASSETDGYRTADNAKDEEDGDDADGELDVPGFSHKEVWTDAKHWFV